MAIDPHAVYSFSRACTMIPSCRADRLDIKTLHRWRSAGRFTAICRTSGRKRWWFVKGSELLKLIGESVQAVPFRTRIPARRRRDHADSLADLKKHGYALAPEELLPSLAVE